MGRSPLLSWVFIARAKPMHLADITMFYAMQGGGVSTYLNAKAHWLARRHAGIRHTIFTPNPCGAAAIAVQPIPGVALPGMHGYRMPSSVRTPARLLRAARPDLVEAGDAGHCAWAALRLQQRHGVPAVAFYHSDLPSLIERRLGRAAAGVAKRYLYRLYRQFDLVLAPSRLMVRRLGEFGIDDALHQPLGIDSTIFHPGRRDSVLRRQLNLAPGTRLLVYAGRFTAEKKLGLLVDALHRLGPPYHLLLIGTGAAVPQSPRITRLPFQRNQAQLARLLASCDVLVHPGDCETFGLIVLEAMACALPVVATQGGGVAELVDHRSGLLARPDSAASLAEAIAAMYEVDRARLGAAARQRACDQYDWQVVLPQLLDRYGALLAARHQALPGRERMWITD
jgi:alpha-1,6-mannosyltransferase